MSPSQAEATPELRHQPGAEAGRTQVLRTAIGRGEAGAGGRKCGVQEGSQAATAVSPPPRSPRCSANPTEGCLSERLVEWWSCRGTWGSVSQSVFLGTPFHRVLIDLVFDSSTGLIRAFFFFFPDGSSQNL